MALPTDRPLAHDLPFKRVHLQILLLVFLAVACQKTALGEELSHGPAKILIEAPTALARSIEQPVALPHTVLLRLIEISPEIYSGAQPDGEEAFAALSALGIKTVVCVDGARPDVELAKSHGLDYVHIPIGYDAIPQAATDSIVRLMSEAALPVYFHCHHGRHRGPAAAAIALRSLTLCNTTSALRVLELAGTSHDYEGLWRDVREWTVPRPNKELPELVSIARVANFSAGMAEVDRTWDRIKDLRKASWLAPERQPDLSLRQETRILHQQLQDCAGQLPAEHIQDPVLWGAMEDVVRSAQRLQEAAEVFDQESLEQAYHEVRVSCKDCHFDYRDQ